MTAKRYSSSGEKRVGRSAPSGSISIGVPARVSSSLGVEADLVPTLSLSRTVSKSRIVPVRFAPDDFMLVERAAGAAGICISEFVRQAVMLGGDASKSDGGSGILSGDELVLFGALLDEVKSVGANINQIAMRLNTGGADLPVGLDASLRELRDLLGGLVFELRQLSLGAVRDKSDTKAADHGA